MSKITRKMPKPRNPISMALAYYFRNKKVKPKKGKGSYVREKGRDRAYRLRNQNAEGD